MSKEKKYNQISLYLTQIPNEWDFNRYGPIINIFILVTINTADIYTTQHHYHFFLELKLNLFGSMDFM